MKVANFPPPHHPHNIEERHKAHENPINQRPDERLYGRYGITKCHRKDQNSPYHWGAKEIGNDTCPIEASIVNSKLSHCYTLTHPLKNSHTLSQIVQSTIKKCLGFSP